MVESSGIFAGERSKMVAEVKVKNEPFITLANIPRALSNFTWGAKVALCNKYALSTMEHGRRFQVENLKKATAPWELNQLAAFFVISKDGEIEEIPDPLFRMMINSIRDGVPQCIFKGLDHIKRYMSYNLALQQFPYQQEALIIFFRYRYLFSVIDKSHGLDMPQKFKTTFSLEYQDMLAMSALSFLATSQNKFLIDLVRNINQNCDCHLTQTCKSVVELLAIERDDYRRRQSALFEFSSDGPSNAEILLERFPFIQIRDEYFLLLPYLLNFATTRHMFDRMMEKNKGLRSLVGRWAMEPYVRHMFEYSTSYDSVRGSFSYNCGRNTVDSPDIWLQTEGVSIFVEVKLAEAPVQLRQMFESQIIVTLKLAAKHTYQLYSRLKEICSGKARDIISTNWDAVYGVVVVHEDSYSVREDIYNQCFNDHPELSEEERELIRTRITIVGLFSIEQFCYHHRSILPALKERQKEPAGAESILLNVDFLNGASQDLPIEKYFIPIVKEIPIRLFAPNSDIPIVF